MPSRECVCVAWPIDHVSRLLTPVPCGFVSFSRDTNAQTNAPVFQVRVIEPFGKYAGTENTTWTEFQVGNPPASVWEVPNKKYCQQCANCQDTAVMREMFLGMK